MGFQDLPDVHARRNAERVQNDVDRRSVGEIRHVLFGENPGQDALVAVPAGHLVADLQLALDGDEDLDHLDHAGRELVATLQAVDLLLRHAMQTVDLIAHRAAGSLELSLDALVADPDVAPVGRRDVRIDILVGDALALVEELAAVIVGETVRGLLADDELLDLPTRALTDDADLILFVLAQTLRPRSPRSDASARPWSRPCARRRARR